MTLSRARSALSTFRVKLKVKDTTTIPILSTSRRDSRELKRNPRRNGALGKQSRKSRGNGLESRIRRVLVGHRVVGVSSQAELSHVDL